MSAITTTAPTKQKRPKPVSAHCAASSSFVALVAGDECMESPEEKARELLLRALNRGPMTFRVMPRESVEVPI